MIDLFLLTISFTEIHSYVTIARAYSIQEFMSLPDNILTVFLYSIDVVNFVSYVKMGKIMRFERMTNNFDKKIDDDARSNISIYKLKSPLINSFTPITVKKEVGGSFKLTSRKNDNFRLGRQNSKNRFMNSITPQNNR